MKRPNESQTAQEPVATHASETMLPVRVAEIMARDVITVHPDQTLADAISLIAAHHFHHLVVTDAGGKVVGNHIRPRPSTRRGSHTRLAQLLHT